MYAETPAKGGNESTATDTFEIVIPSQDRRVPIDKPLTGAEVRRKEEKLAAVAADRPEALWQGEKERLMALGENLSTAWTPPYGNTRERLTTGTALAVKSPGFAVK